MESDWIPEDIDLRHGGNRSGFIILDFQLEPEALGVLGMNFTCTIVPLIQSASWCLTAGCKFPRSACDVSGNRSFCAIVNQGFKVSQRRIPSIAQPARKSASSPN